MATRHLPILVAAVLIALGSVTFTLGRAGALVPQTSARIPLSPHAPMVPPTVSGGATAFRWMRQFGTPTPDEATAVAVDGLGVYVAGITGNSSGAFLRKYDLDGKVVWSQFGTGGDLYVRAIAVEGSHLFVAGTARFPDDPGFRFAAFLWMYDLDGNVVWMRQFSSSGSTSVSGLAVDGSGAYLGGLTDGTLPNETGAGTAFVEKYDFSGNVVWTRQFGSSGLTGVSALAVNALGLYVAGWAEGTFPGEPTFTGIQDAFLRKCDLNGTAAWTHQFEISEVASANAVAANGSDVYVAGTTGVDAFLRKFDSGGDVEWTHQFGTTDGGYAWGLAVSGHNVYVVGSTRGGTFPGEQGAGGYDAFIQKYDAGGAELWTHQFGTSGSDMAMGAAADASSTYVAGVTDATFAGQVSAGSADAFVASIDTTPPVVAITSPQNDANIRSATVTVTGSALDDVDVASVEVSTDGTTWLVATGTTSWSANLTLREGSNSISARATDTTRNIGTTKVTIIAQIVSLRGDRLPLIVLAAGVGSLAGAVVAVVYVLRRRKQGTVRPPTWPPPRG